MDMLQKVPMRIPPILAPVPVKTQSQVVNPRSPMMKLSQMRPLTSTNDERGVVFTQ